MSEVSFKTTPPILPEMVLKYAWGLTIAHSEDKTVDAKAEADKIRNRLTELEKRFSDKAGSNYTPQNKSYLEEVETAINSCMRNLHIIIQGRNLNFKETDSYLATQRDNIQSISKLTSNLGSSINRLSSMAVGGFSMGAIVVTVFPSVPQWAVPMLIFIAAALAYGFHEWKIVPWTRNKINIELVKTDIRRQMYFQSYVNRSKIVLKSLLDDVLTIYERVYGSPYRSDIYDLEEKRWEIVKNTITGIEDESPFVCKYLVKHYIEDKITPEFWVICESGRNVEDCPYYEK